MPTLLTPDGTREGGIRTTYNAGLIEVEADYHFVVEADSLLQSRKDIVFNTPGLPLPGDFIDGLKVRSQEANRNQDHGLRWEVVLTASNSLEDTNNNGANTGDPTLWVPTEKILYEVKEEMSETDYSNTPIANSAGIPYSTGVMKRRYLPVWEFVQFEPASVGNLDLLSRMEVTNSATWKGKAAKTWLCRVLDSYVGFFAGYRCRLVVYRLTYDEKKWTDKRLDKGDSYKSGSKLLPWINDAGVVIDGPLNGSGAMAGTRSAPGTPAIREFDQYASVPFTFLRI